MIRAFVDREEERRILDEEWQKAGGRMIILYGRRRIGKTRLLAEFVQGKQGILSFSEDVASAIQIKQFQAECAAFFNDDLLASLRMETWDQVFTYLAQKPLKERAYLVIDEFTYLIKNDPSLLSALQKAWDTALSGSNWCILLCGSMLGLMSDLALSATSPLYGRRTRDMLLEALPFVHAKKFLDQPFPDALRTYLTIGGIPEYLLKAADYASFSEFVEREFFSRFGYFYREPYFILSQEFRELKTYQSILHAIADGNTAPGAIAQFCGMDARRIYPYLEGMTRLGIVERELPILVDTRHGIYRIKDTVFDFWYSFVFLNREAIETDTFRPSVPAMDRYFGKRFEGFVRREVVPRVLPGSRVGRWWWKGEEIDVVAVDDQEHGIVFGECKWGALDRREARGVLTRLEAKAEMVRHDRYPKERYLLVAGSVEGKEDLRDEGYLVYDLADIEGFMRGE
jgi:AAA+ ATPase superfamily predicted ATPase